MKLVAVIRPSATVTVEGSGVGVVELRSSVLDQGPEDHELAQLLVHSGRVDGNLVGTGVFRSTLSATVEADGSDYRAAREALGSSIPSTHQVLSIRVVE